MFGFVVGHLVLFVGMWVIVAMTTSGEASASASSTKNPLYPA